MPLVKSPTNIDTVAIISLLRQITSTIRAIASSISFTAMVRIPSRPMLKPNDRFLGCGMAIAVEGCGSAIAFWGFGRAIAVEGCEEVR